jgi:hypothetical protein
VTADIFLTATSHQDLLNGFRVPWIPVLAKRSNLPECYDHEQCFPKPLPLGARSGLVCDTVVFSYTLSFDFCILWLRRFLRHDGSVYATFGRKAGI